MFEPPLLERFWFCPKCRRILMVPSDQTFVRCPHDPTRIRLGLAPPEPARCVPVYLTFDDFKDIDRT